MYMVTQVKDFRKAKEGECALCREHKPQLKYRFLHTPICDDCGKAAEYLEVLAERPLHGCNEVCLEDSETLKARTLLLKAQEKVVMAGPGYHHLIKYAESNW